MQVLTRRHGVSPRESGDQLDECCFDCREAPGPSHESQQVQAGGEPPLQPASRDCRQAGEVADERQDEADVVEEEAPRAESYWKTVGRAGPSAVLGWMVVRVMSAFAVIP